MAAVVYLVLFALLALLLVAQVRGTRDQLVQALVG